MIKGIPYFGSNTQQITKQILNSEIIQEIEYDSLYLLVKNNIYKRLIVIIDNKWLTWLNDIAFNYRDKKCYLPYYTYEIYEDNSKTYRSNNKGHLILKDSALLVRYNYKYNEIKLDLTNLSFIVYDLDTKEKYRIKTNKWYNSNQFSINKLYNLYIDSSYRDDDYLYNWNGDIYHNILRNNKFSKNKEKQIRERLNLEHISNIIDIPHDYRDVRQYKIEEIINKIGFRDTNDLYRLRRLKFESYLFCILRQGCKPEEHVEDWEELGVTKHYIKIGEHVKLIIKSYWLDEYKPIQKRTWSRIEYA